MPVTSGTSSAVDTVERATATPDQPQPFRELGLKDDEYERIRQILGRRPTDAELAMYSVMWSEHCSYKSSKVHLRYFGETTTDEMRAGMLAGIGENAGVVDIGDGWAVTFKVESHNHPSYVEPYQGAATGVGGIVRDIMAMGARPVAVMDQLRFGAADAPDTRRVLDGVVRGVGGYGNSLGLPNIGGETVFDPSYAGNPLVNALCVGVLRKEDLHLAFASGTGNKIILFGARTGLDGIGGVSVLASDTFSGDESGAGERTRKKLPSVQVGDPFTEKVLIECCLELYAADLVVGIQDLGGAGLSCATSELASAGDGGMAIELDKVPLRAANMTPAEVLSSESQERMCAVVTPENVEAFMAVCRKWDVLATVIGEVTDGDRLHITWNGQTVVDVPPRTVAHEGPVYQRPVQRPDTQDDLIADSSKTVRRPESGEELRATLLALLGSPHLCSRAFITEQYDRYVRGNTVLAEHADGGVLRIDEATGRGIAMSTDASGRYTQLDPYAGAQLALAEAYRNVAATGATPGRGHQLPQLRLARGPRCDVAVRSGRPWSRRRLCGAWDSGHRWQRQFLQPDRVDGHPAHAGGRRARRVRRCELGVIPTGLGTEPGETLILLGDTHDEFDGSIWAQVTADHLGGVPPRVDLAREKLLADVLTAASRDGLVSAAHDLSEGGLMQTVVEAALAGETGCRILLPEDADPFVALFSESAGRVLVAVPRTEESRFMSMCEARGLPATRIGVVDHGSDSVEVQGQFTVPLAELRSTWEGTLPKLFG